jgi:hypothetical protein
VWLSIDDVLVMMSKRGGEGRVGFIHSGAKGAYSHFIYDDAEVGRAEFTVTTRVERPASLTVN